jgi:hypothetical protein
MAHQKQHAEWRNTTPLFQINTRMSMAAALEYETPVSLLHYRDAVLTGVELALHCMTPAIGEIANSVLERGTMRIGNVVLHAVPGHQPSTADILILKDDAPGAYHMRIKRRGVLTSEGEKRMKAALDKLQHLPLSHRIIAMIDDPHIEAIKSDASLHKPWSAAEPVENISVTALSLNSSHDGALPGCPEGFAKDEAVALDEHWPDPSGPCPASMKGWWSGIILDHTPCADDGLKNIPGRATLGRNDPWASPALLETFSGLIRMAALEDMVTSRLNCLREQTFPIVNIGNSYARIETGLGAVKDSGGFFDAGTTNALDAYGRHIVGSELIASLTDIDTCIADLGNNGFTSADNKYLCNDMRDQAWVEDKDGVRTIHAQCESLPLPGRLDIQGDVIRAWIGDDNIGQFNLKDDGLLDEHIRIYSGAQGIRQMSSLLASVATISCNLSADINDIRPDSGDCPSL